MSILNEIISSDNKPMVLNYKQIEYVNIDDIVPNKENKMYSMENIEDIMQSILLVGLQTPLLVKKQDNKYLLMSGHRRLKAIKTLKEQGKYDEDVVMCVEYKSDTVDLPLDEDKKDKLILMDTNKQRIKTDSDIANEIKNYKEIFKELKNKGFTSVTLDETTLNLKGKVRDLVAEAVGISSSQVQKFDHVTKNGSEKLNKALNNNEISINTADKIASLDIEDQNELLDNGQLTISDINNKMSEYDDDFIDGTEITERNNYATAIMSLRINSKANEQIYIGNDVNLKYLDNDREIQLKGYIVEDILWDLKEILVKQMVSKTGEFDEVHIPIDDITYIKKI